VVTDNANIMREVKKIFIPVSYFISFSEKMASSRHIKWIVIALLPVMILMMYPVDRFDYDVWWQMALGKYYLNHQTLVVDHSIFAWTPSDSTWIYNTFLGSIVFYLIYSLMGGFGLWVLQWMIFLGIFFAFYVYFRVVRQPLDVTSLTVIAAVGITFSASCTYYKPELFSPLFLAWMAAIFACVKFGEKNKNLFYIYPLFFVLWVNLHGGFIIGLCLLACLCVGELLNKIIFPQASFSKDQLAHLWLASFLSGLTTLLNPYGVNYLLSIYNAALSDTYFLQSNYIQAYVSIWSFFKYLKDFDSVFFFKMGQLALIMASMMIILLALLIYDYLKNKYCDFTILILTLATFWGSMRAVRAIYMFPLIFLSFFYFLNKLKFKNFSVRLKLISLIVFTLLFVNISYFTLRYGMDNKWFGSGLEGFAPVQEVAFLKKYRLPEPIFNDYLTGGYLLWDLYPDYKVFIDPRHGPYWKQVAPDYWDFVNKPPTPGDVRRFNEKYPFKTALIHFRELPLIFDFLNAGWRLVFFEKKAAILVHESIHSQIPPEVQQVDIGPERFRDVKDPEVLLSVFSIYVNLYPRASPVIYDIYKKNVSDWYKPKNEHLRVMSDDMNQALYSGRKPKLESMVIPADREN
jgi:hypothetical protein